MADQDPVREKLADLGAFIREQRQRAELSLRELASRANVSNPYLSQLERGLHEPSVRVLTSIARALNISADALLRGAGLLDPDAENTQRISTEDAIRADPLLTEEQRRSLLAVYRAYVEGNKGIPSRNEDLAPAETSASEIQKD